MKHLLIGLFLSFCFVSVAQEEINTINVPKNEINFEHGYLNRGIFGASYARNFAKRESTYWGVTGSAGAGVQIIDASFLFDGYTIFFFGLTPSFQYGVGNNFLSFGLEIKNISSSEAYNGFGVGGYAGFSYNGPKGFLFKLRLGATSWSEGSTGIPYYEFANQRVAIPMLGFSIGYGFGGSL